MNKNDGKIRVLIIEDDPQQMDIFRIYFERNKIDIERSYDGFDGLRVAKNWKPDFIILDIRMEGMDGLEVMRNLQKDNRTKTIPVIAYTNYDPKQINKKMFKLNVIAVWEKTVVRPSELVNQIKKMYTITRCFKNIPFVKLRDKLRANI